MRASSPRHVAPATPVPPPPERLASRNIRLGTAGWSIPSQSADAVPGEGSHLERYSRVFRCAEINSSFHRPHRLSTYARWAASTPVDFQFSVKVPKSITHKPVLDSSQAELQTFLEQVSHLGAKLGPMLFQLPPRQAFDPATAQALLGAFRDLRPKAPAALEPRHPSWFSPEANQLLEHLHIARVMADPPPSPEARTPAGARDLLYFRLHGSPRVYYSSYPDSHLQALAAEIASRPPASEVWCIFDNTASGAALADALALNRYLAGVPARTDLP